MEKIHLLKSHVGLSLFFLITFFIFGKIWLLIISSLFLLVILIGGRLSILIGEFWFKSAQFLGNIISKVFLTGVFFFLLTPIAIFYRIFNREVIGFFKDRNRKSFFKDVYIEYKKKDFEKMW